LLLRKELSPQNLSFLKKIALNLIRIDGNDDLRMAYLGLKLS